MRTAVLLVVASGPTGPETEAQFFQDPADARAAFKKCATDQSPPPEVVEIQLWESDAGMVKRKRFGNQQVARDIPKYSRVHLPKDEENQPDKDSFFARQNARILENKERRSKGLDPLPLLVPQTIPVGDRLKQLQEVVEGVKEGLSQAAASGAAETAAASDDEESGESSEAGETVQTGTAPITTAATGENPAAETDGDDAPNPDSEDPADSPPAAPLSTSDSSRRRNGRRKSN